MNSLFYRLNAFALAGAATVFASSSNTFEPFNEVPAFAIRDGQVKPSKNQQASADGSTYVQYGAFFAHGVDGTLRWRTVIGVMNPSDRPCMVAMEFLDSRGNPVAVPFSGANGRYEGDYIGAAATIDPGVNVSPAMMDSRLPAQAAYVRVTSDSGVKVNVDVSIVRMNGLATNAFVYSVTEPSSEAKEINVATSTGQQTTIGILNPGSEPITVVATARTWQGVKACSVSVTVGPGQSIWTNVNSLIYCVRPNSFTHTLNLAPENGSIVVHGYYEQAGFATAPVHSANQ